MISIPRSRVATPAAAVRTSAPGPSGLEEFGDAAFAMGAEMRRQEDAEKLAIAQLDDTRAQQALRLELEQDTDYTTLSARHAERSTALRAERAAALPDHLRSGFVQRSQMAGLGHEAAVANRALTLRTGEGRNRVTLDLDELHAMAADNADPAARDAAAITAAARLQDAVVAGLYTETEAEDLARTQARRLQSVDAARLMTDDPAALADTLEAGGFETLRPLERESMRARAVAATKTRAAIEERELKDDLLLAETARAAGSTVDDEDAIVARADAMGEGDAARRAIDRGMVLSRVPDMDRAELRAQIEALRAGGVTEGRDVTLITTLVGIEEAAVLAERKAAEKTAKETRDALEKRREAVRKAAEKATAEERKAMNKRVDENISGLLDGSGPIVLDDLNETRETAHFLGRGDEFERAWEIAGVAMRADKGIPEVTRADAGALPPPRRVAEGRAIRRLEEEAAKVDRKRADDPVQYEIDKGANLPAFDLADPASIRRRVTVAPVIWQEGTARRYLSDAEIKAQAATLEAADADDRAAMIGGMTATVGPAVALDMMREIGVADPLQRHAAQYLAASGDQRLYLEAQRGADRAEQTGERIAPSVRKRVRAATLGDLFGVQHAAQEAGVMAMADALYAARSGGTDPEDEAAQEDLYTVAIRDALGGETASFGTGRVLLPLGIETEQAQDALSMLSDESGFLETGATAILGMGRAIVGGQAPEAVTPPDLSRIGMGGAPDIGGAPMPRHLFSRARYRPVGDGLFELTVLNHDGRALPVMRDDRPDEPWTLDLRALVELSEETP